MSTWKDDVKRTLCIAASSPSSRVWASGSALVVWDSSNGDELRSVKDVDVLTGLCCWGGYYFNNGEDRVSRLLAAP